MMNILTAFIALVMCSPALYADTVNATVIEVVDVGTLRVEYNGLEERLRLIGITVPAKNESDNYDQGYSGTPGGDAQKAADFVRSLLFPGDKITLEFDIEPRDRENNLLAYVYLNDNSILNYTVLLQGYAVPQVSPPNVKYAGQFDMAYQDARNHSRGLWKNR